MRVQGFVRFFHIHSVYSVGCALLLLVLSSSFVACKDEALIKKAAALEEENEQKTKKIQTLEATTEKLKKALKTSNESLSTLKKQVEANENREKLQETARQLGLLADQKLFATFKTTKGTMVAELFWQKVPQTVLNFVQLAEGKKEWTDPKTGKKTKRPLYAGTIFHRVIPNFMIQGGDPVGTGRGGPGYTFADEFHPSLKHDSAGVLSMANRGPDTNGSQFFITAAPTPHLDQRHSVFGKLVRGTELVHEIAAAEKAGPRQKARPKNDIILKRLLIGRGKPKP